MPARLLFLCVVLGAAVEARAEERQGVVPTDEPAGRALQAENPCDGLGTSLAVDTEEHRLWLCKDGVAEKSFTVSLGRSLRAGGGHAVAAHGAPRLTEDLGVFVDPTLANAARLREALLAFGLGSDDHGGCTPS